MEAILTVGLLIVGIRFDISMSPPRYELSELE